MSDLYCSTGLSLFCLSLKHVRHYVHIVIYSNSSFLSSFEETGRVWESLVEFQLLHLQLVDILSSFHSMPMRCWWSHWDGVAQCILSEKLCQEEPVIPKKQFLVLLPILHFPILNWIFRNFYTLKSVLTNRWNVTCLWISEKYEEKLTKCSSVGEHLPGTYELLVSYLAPWK